MARPDDDRPRPKRGGGRPLRRGAPKRGAQPKRGGGPKARGAPKRGGGQGRRRDQSERAGRPKGRGAPRRSGAPKRGGSPTRGGPRSGARPGARPGLRSGDDRDDRSSRPPTGPAAGEAAAIFREARRAAKRATQPTHRPRPPRPADERPLASREQDEWLDEGRTDDPAALRGRDRTRPSRPPRPGGRGSRGRPPPAPSGRAAALSDLSDREHKKLRQASTAFEDEQFNDARRLLNDLARAHPDVAEIRELLGLTHYRLENWRAAARELEAFAALSGSAEQHPVLADCYRAVGRHRRVDELWDELAAASPSGPLVAEGRIVTAGSLADRGDLAAAIAHLEPAARRTAKLRPHDVRVLYALADLHERAGEVPTARELFARIVHRDPRFADAATRLDELG